MRSNRRGSSIGRLCPRPCKKGAPPPPGSPFRPAILNNSYHDPAFSRQQDEICEGRFRGSRVKWKWPGPDWWSKDRRQSDRVNLSSPGPALARLIRFIVRPQICQQFRSEPPLPRQEPFSARLGSGSLYLPETASEIQLAGIAVRSHDQQPTVCRPFWCSSF
jgi:hypothetical protein